MARILEEAASDAPAVEALLDLCFGPERRRKTAQRLRDGRRPAKGLALIACEGDRLVGTLRFWDVEAGPGAAALLLGPLAVHPEAQGRGLGAQLVSEGLGRARQRGHRAVILVGDPDYYGRFGFERALTLGLSLPGPVEARRFLGLELEPGALRAAEGAVRPSGRRAAAVFTRKPKTATRLAA